VRLNNDRHYVFGHRRDVGATRSGGILVWFGPDDEMVRIDAASIAEIIEAPKTDDQLPPA
jgi:hypothetical protein